MVDRLSARGGSRVIRTGGSGVENSEIGHVAAKASPMTRLGRRVVIMGDCWVVDGEPDKYHSVHVGGGQSVGAHRYVWQEVNDISLHEFEHVHHRCHNPGCINPEHLRLMVDHRHSSYHSGTGDDVEWTPVPSPPAWWLEQQEREHTP
jgi:hypothetical protein